MILPRAQLFEFNDVAWAPAAVRDSIVEALSRTLRWGRMLRDLAPRFCEFLAAAGATEVLDLCAGAAGPAALLAEELGPAAPRFILTDLFPRPAAWQAARAARPEVFDFEPAPVDATRIPPALARGRARTIINAFHHFPPDMARAILADAVRGSAGIFVSELFDRNPLRLLSVMPAGVAALLAGPALAPERRLAKAALTWASPVMGVAGSWDALVSTLRVYTEAELRAMAASAGGDFRWVYGTYRFRPFGKGYYFYGVPRAP